MNILFRNYEQVPYCITSAMLSSPVWRYKNGHKTRAHGERFRSIQDLLRLCIHSAWSSQNGCGRLYRSLVKTPDISESEEPLPANMGLSFQSVSVTVLNLEELFIVILFYHCFADDVNFPA